MSFSFRACFQVIFVSSSESKFLRLGLPNRGFRMEGIAKNALSWKSCFFVFQDRFLLFSESLGYRFSDSCNLENKVENEAILCDVADPESVNWGW